MVMPKEVNLRRRLALAAPFILVVLLLALAVGVGFVRHKTRTAIGAASAMEDRTSAVLRRVEPPVSGDSENPSALRRDRPDNPVRTK
jgi:hypothetical protein